MITSRSVVKMARKRNGFAVRYVSRLANIFNLLLRYMVAEISRYRSNNPFFFRYFSFPIHPEFSVTFRYFVTVSVALHSPGS